MRVYQFAVQEGYEWVVPVDRSDFQVLGSLDGSSKRVGWIPPSVKLLPTDEKGRPRAESDFPWLGSHAPVLRQRAVDTVGHLFQADGEFLPLSCDSADLQVFNVLNVVDALDLERSELGRLPNTNQIIRVKKHVFVADRVRGLGVFKIPQLVLQSAYVTEDIAESLQSSKLKGVGIRLVWEETAAAPAARRSNT